MRRSPEVLALSSKMETPAGRRAACLALSVAPSVALFLDLAGLSPYAMKVTAIGIVFQAVLIAVTFWVGGRSLLRAIDESLRHHHQQRRETATALTGATAATAATGGTGWTGETVGGEEENEEKSGNTAGIGSLTTGSDDQPLQAAKKKIVRMIAFALQTVVVVMSMLLVTICTDYGVAAPLPFFMVPSE